MHLEISRPFDPDFPFDTLGGFLNNLGEMLIPVTCGIQPFNPWLFDGDSRVANPCNDNCTSSVLVNGSVVSGQGYIARADTFVTTDGTSIIEFSSGSTTQFRAGDYIKLNPGFHVREGSKFAAILRACNEQN